MDPRYLGALYDGGVPILAGLFVTLLAFRVIGKKPGADANYDEKHQRYLAWLKWGGPVMMVIGLILGLRSILLG